MAWKKNIKISIIKALFSWAFPNSSMHHHTMQIHATVQVHTHYAHSICSPFNYFIPNGEPISLTQHFPHGRGGETRENHEWNFRYDVTVRCILVSYWLNTIKTNVHSSFFPIFSSTFIHLFCCIFPHSVAFAIAQTHNKFRPLQPWLPRKRKHIQLHTELNFASMSYILFFS